MQTDLPSTWENEPSYLISCSIVQYMQMQSMTSHGKAPEHQKTHHQQPTNCPKTTTTNPTKTCPPTHIDLALPTADPYIRNMVFINKDLFTSYQVMLTIFHNINICSNLNKAWTIRISLSSNEGAINRALAISAQRKCSCLCEATQTAIDKN